MREAFVEVVEERAAGSPVQDKTWTDLTAVQIRDEIAERLRLLLSSERHVIRAWRGGAGAAELGIAVRQTLGSPRYSQIGETH